MKLLHSYKNGNYSVLLYEDGTKIRYNDEDYFEADFPENIDLCVSKKCSIGCPFCHESATKDGAIADLSRVINFIDKLKPGTEIALGGGALSELPAGYLTALATFCHDKGLVLNMTVNQAELEKPDFFSLLKSLRETGLIIGAIGVSFTKPSYTLKDLQAIYKDNLVIHTINGVTKEENYKWLAENGFKILILGYKDFGRGVAYKAALPENLRKNQEYLEQNIMGLVSSAKLVSFDNLALEQLSIKDKISKEAWEEFYMGDDGTATMYVDAVSEEYAINSTQPKETRRKYRGDESIEDIFADVKRLKKELQRENK